MFKSNNSRSTTSDSEKRCYNFNSISSVVYYEVTKMLKELSVSEEDLSQDKIQRMIVKCLKEKIVLPKTSKFLATSTNDSLNTPENTPESAYESTPENIPVSAPESGSQSIFETRDEMDITVEEVDDLSQEYHALIIENFQLLQHRLTKLEKRISKILQKIPKIQYEQTKQFKISANIIKRALLKEMKERKANNETVQSRQTATQIATETTDNEQIVENKIKNEEKMYLAAAEEKRRLKEKFDRLYYEHRENDMNKLRYKKSEVTMQLNQRTFEF